MGRYDWMVTSGYLLVGGASKVDRNMQIIGYKHDNTIIASLLLTTITWFEVLKSENYNLNLLAKHIPNNNL